VPQGFRDLGASVREAAEAAYREELRPTNACGSGAAQRLALADHTPLIANRGIAALRVIRVFQGQKVGVAVLGKHQAQPPSGDNLGPASVHGVGHGGLGYGSPLGSLIREITVGDQRVPSGKPAMLLLVIRFGGVDGADNIDGQAVLFALPVLSRWRWFLLRCPERYCQDSNRKQDRANT
jgi:hypothetical protein